MKTCTFLSSSTLTSIFLILQHLCWLAYAYKPLSDGFLQNISSGGLDFDPNYGKLLSPILIPRVPGSEGHSVVQHHFVNFFSTELPRWTLEWYNSTATVAGIEVPIANLVFQREPPWTKPGQANWLTLAAHYDSKDLPHGFVGATDGAIPCAVLMHVARSIDRYVTQMHDEMAELGEGGTVAMDMGVQILFLDGREAFDEKGSALYGSRYDFQAYESDTCFYADWPRTLSETWEMKNNPAGSRYPNALSQISMFVLLDALGSVNPTIPSYFILTHWVYKCMASLEERLRKLWLLETSPRSAFFPKSNETEQAELAYDQVPFMNRGVPFLHLLPSPLPPNWHTLDDNGDHLH